MPQNIGAHIAYPFGIYVKIKARELKRITAAIFIYSLENPVKTRIDRSVLTVKIHVVTGADDIIKIRTVVALRKAVKLDTDKKVDFARVFSLKSAKLLYIFTVFLLCYTVARIKKGVAVVGNTDSAHSLRYSLLNYLARSVISVGIYTVSVKI